MSEPAEPELSDVLRDRREKLERIREAGIEPFPHEFSGREDIAEVRAAHEGLAPGMETDSRHRVAGRIVARRGHGKACFLDLRDGSGQIQLHAREDLLGEEAYGLLVDLDLGDIIGVEAVSSHSGSTTGACWPRACARRRTSSMASRTPRRASAAASST
jgi:lysyl-tRNA synthetase class 2